MTHFRKQFNVFLIATGIVLACGKGIDGPESLPFRQPSYFPDPIYRLADNPLTKQGFELGKSLFYDPQLSADNTISCASCHIQASGFTHHGHDVSHGIYNRFGTRNAPAIMNLAWYSSYMHDGGIFDLDLQPVAPITNPAEMDETLEHVLQKLKTHPRYPALFKDAFPDDSISTTTFLKALSQFMIRCISADAKYDSVKRGEAYFTEKEEKGYSLFLQHCNSCHTEPLFTNNSFKNNGVPINPRFNDKGRAMITLNEDDEYKFKVPTLRNLAFSPPYMHDGSISNLDEVFVHYVYNMQPVKNIDPIFYRPGQNPGVTLSITEQGELKAFLNTLNDIFFVRNNELIPN
jgi:cytochrome c peroxidase